MESLCLLINFYPRSPCGERHPRSIFENRHNMISIHALLAESDACNSTYSFSFAISIHALLAESDLATAYTAGVAAGFLSTLSLRRATLPVQRYGWQLAISIHALLAESDRSTWRTVHTRSKFLSTLSLRRATAKVHKTVGHFCAYETNFMGIASSC